MTQTLIDALMQVFIALILGLMFWGIAVFTGRLRGAKTPSYVRFMGLHFNGFTWNLGFSKVFFAVITIGLLSNLTLYHFVDEFMQFSKSDSSPYWKILKDGLSFKAVVLALIYCWIQAGLSEEILFRGIIAKRLINMMGFKWGNVSQALIFWLIHFLLVGAVAETWLSLFQFIVFITIFPIAMFMGYANEKFCGGSIAASWILHSSLNVVTFFLLAYLLN